MKKINIGIFVDTFFPIVDGVVHVVDKHATLLSKYCNVYVICPIVDKNYVDNFKYSVIRIKEMKMPFVTYSLATPKFDRKKVKKIFDLKLDIVHIHSPFTIGKIGVKYAKKFNVPSIYHFNSQYKIDFKQKLKLNWLVKIGMHVIKKVTKKTDYTFVLHEGFLDKKLLDEYGVSKKTYIFNNCVEMDKISNKNKEIDKKNIRIENNIRDDYKILLFVGRIESVKNIFFILDVLEELILKDFKFKMIFIGTGSDEKKFLSEINKRNLSTNIIFKGLISDRDIVRKYYAGSDLFIFPSEYDTSSLVQKEAASQLTPTIFLEGSMTSKMIKNNYNGYLSEKNSDIFSDKIINIFKNMDKYMQVSNNAQIDLSKKWDSVVDSMYETYLDLIEINNAKKNK